MGERLTNWAGNVTFAAARVHRPRTADELRDLLTRTRRARVLGSGHSFNRIADTTGDLVHLGDLPRTVQVAADRRSVRVGGGVRYGDLVPHLDAAGLALPNLASLPHLTVAGAVTTATHGSGAANGNLATAVSGLELLRAGGGTVTLRRDDPDLAGAVVGLCALGVVTTLTLDVVPAYELRQYAYDDLPWAAVEGELDAVLGAGYSVSVFTTWAGPTAGHVVRKVREPLPDGPFHGARPADGPRHPVPGQPAGNVTEQGGVPGPWHARLPHFRPEATPSTGAELQSEWLVPAARAGEAVAAMRRAGPEIAPVLQVSEIRAIAADDLWLSPNHRRDSVGLHFTWTADTAAVLPAVAAVEDALAPLDARPHWGKLSTLDPAEVRGRYPRFGDFAALAARYDPDGVFRNAWLDALLG